MQTAVYFDLDGTLTDPFDGISRSLTYALDHFDIERPDDATMRSYIGPPLRDTFATLIDEDQIEHAIDLYRERYAADGWRENYRYTGIREALSAIQETGARLYVATSKPHVSATKIVEHFGLDNYFDYVYGPELDGTRNDKTELLAYALEKSPPVERHIMIGDRRHDMIGATNNNMFAIGVAWGYGTIDELRAAGARTIAESPSELPGIVATL